MYMCEYFISEQTEPLILYHGSSIQNLKYLHIQKSKSTHDMKIGNKYIYASPNKSYAAGFTFDWTYKIASFGKYDKNEPWTLEINGKYKNLLKQPCSIYILNPSTFKKINNYHLPEYISETDCEIIKEYKYKNVIDCLKSNNVILKIKEIL